MQDLLLKRKHSRCRKLSL